MNFSRYIPVKNKSTMQNILVLFCLVITNIAAAQNIEVVSKGNFQFEEKGRYFAFLETKTDTSRLQYVASFKASAEDKRASISDLFFGIKHEAQNLGATCFRLKTYSRDGKNTSIELDAYFGDDSLLHINAANHEKNTVFVFCSDRLTDEKYSIKVNDKKREFASGTYMKFQLKEGEELKLNKGGFTGASMWLNYKPDKPALFVTTTGFGLDSPMAPGTVGLSFNTGRFNYMDESLGRLLTQILKQSE
jgi:hypothetical protein